MGSCDAFPIQHIPTSDQHKCINYIPITECINLDVSKRFPAAVQELALSGSTLKLDLVIIVYLLSNSLHLDTWVESEDASHAVLPLQIDLQKKNGTYNTVVCRQVVTRLMDSQN